MTDIIDFPIKDPVKLFIGKVREQLGETAWERIGPVIEHIWQRHGQLPEWKVDFHPTGFERFTEDERQTVVAGIRQMVIKYGTMCRELVMADLAVAMIENADLKRQLAELKK